MLESVILVLLTAASWIPGDASGLQIAALPNSIESPCGGEAGFRVIPPAVVQSAVAAAKISATDVIYDAGTGNAAFLLQAARIRQASGVGNSTCPAGRKDATANAARLGLGERVVIRSEPMASADLTGYTVVTLMLQASATAELVPKLLSDLKPGARIVSFQFGLGAWKPDRTIDVDGWSIYLYTVPSEEIIGAAPINAVTPREREASIAAPTIDAPPIAPPPPPPPPTEAVNITSPTQGLLANVDLAQHVLTLTLAEGTIATFIFDDTTTVSSLDGNARLLVRSEGRALDNVRSVRVQWMPDPANPSRHLIIRITVTAME